MDAISRRQALLWTLLASSGLAAVGRGAAQGRSGLAPAPSARRTRRLLLVTSRHGEPLGANVPGTYDDPAIVHPRGPEGEWAPFVQAGRPHAAAALWTQLPAALREQTCFVHHRPQTSAHGSWSASLSPLPEALARATAPALGCLQVAPICLGPDEETLTYAGERLPRQKPTALARRLLTDAALHAGPLAAPLDTAAKDDGPAGQLAMAQVLFALNAAPVVTVHLPWGGDNHRDAGLREEGRQQAQSVAQLRDFYRELAALKLADEVTTLVLPHFGRTLARAHKGDAGRDHNGRHNVAVLLGGGVAGGVLGGVGAEGRDYAALPAARRATVAALTRHAVGAVAA